MMLIGIPLMCGIILYGGCFSRAVVMLLVHHEQTPILVNSMMLIYESVQILLDPFTEHIQNL